MTLVPSTYKILADKVLGHSFDSSWTDWAVDMLRQGFDTEYLVILAGISPPFNQFELKSLTDKVLDELGLDYSDKEKTIKNYVCYLADEVLSNRLDAYKALRELRDLYNELNQPLDIQDFYLLYFAKVDLLGSENQWYWNGATRDNIDKIIRDRFSEWTKNCKTTTA
jgi:hypothetical protein